MKNVAEVAEEFRVGEEELIRIAEDFESDIKRSLSKNSTSLKMLPSYLTLPTGDERGDFVALDFGGTNARSSLIRLSGDGHFETLSTVKKPLMVPGEYSHIDSHETAEGLFDFLAGLVGDLSGISSDVPIKLGHTFSFASSQDSPKDARLIGWAKEISVPGVTGRLVNELLRDALCRAGLGNVIPTAILNDTVAVLLSAAYRRRDIFIGSIYATGHNTAYLEEGSGEPVILNMESGGFDKVRQNRFDVALDEASESPGAQRLEKMVSGRYLGKLFSLALSSASGVEIPEIDAKSLVSVAEKGDAGMALWGSYLGSLSSADLERISGLAEAIVRRSARIVAATFAAVIRHRAGFSGITAQSVAIEGSFYANVPMARRFLREAMTELMGRDAEKIETVMVEDGASFGAAIAAAMV